MASTITPPDQPRDGLARRTLRRLKIGEFLVEKGLIDKPTLNALTQNQNRHTSSAPKRLVSLAVEQGLMSHKAAAKVLGQFFGLPGIILKDRTFDPSLLPQAPLEMMREKRFIPLDATDRFIYVAMGDPNNLDLVMWIEAATGKRLRVMVALDSDIDEIIRVKMGLGPGSAHSDDPFLDFESDPDIARKIRSHIADKSDAALPPPAPAYTPPSPPAHLPVRSAGGFHDVLGDPAPTAAPSPDFLDFGDTDPFSSDLAPPSPRGEASPQVNAGLIADLEYRVQLLELLVAQLIEMMSDEEVGVPPTL
ncbi:MAG: hypothetical protein COX57_05150 [Alphaproteobacteria bacterium CG_4_10_14_0_2_um_filter_63_37]|nr:MAG: hypothetical protein COX57_05150 [Alphaproteobacteria bacterium CG_4_10_14_0_2_um_filter_63_37]